jgi:hypothetical protein
MFVVSKNRQNYSSAITSCEKINGELAHIVSERRTNEISKLLKNSMKIKDVSAFIGLNETKMGKFVTSREEPLECFFYRAWELKHPAQIRKQACVVISSENSWKISTCDKKNPFICEFLANGPNPHVISDFTRKCSIVQRNNRFGPKRN